MTPQPALRRDQLRVLDLSSPQRQVRVEIEVSPAHELIAAITALSHTESWDTYAEGAAWLNDLRSRMSDDLRSRVGQQADPAACYPKYWAHLVGLVHSAPRRDDVDAVIDHIAGLPDESLYRVLLEGSLGGAARREHAVLVDAVVAGDRSAGAPLITAVCEDDQWERDSLRALLAQEPAAVKEDVVTVLRATRQLLRDHLDQSLPALRHDADERRLRIRGLPVDEAVKEGTDGIHYQPEPWVRRVLLIPQVAMRPWVMIVDHADLKIFLVAVADESLSVDRDTPPARLLALTKALGEEQRLRILRRLRSGPASLQQITDHLGIAKSTAHHHLVQLRSAGLVIVEMGQEKEYTLRDGIVGDLSQLLDTYLRGGAR